jgi:hypothetical protein
MYHIVSELTITATLWMTEEWTLLIMEVKTTCSSWGIMALLYYQRVVPVLKDRKIFPTSSYQQEFKLGNIP